MWFFALNLGLWSNETSTVRIAARSASCRWSDDGRIDGKLTETADADEAARDGALTRKKIIVSFFESKRWLRKFPVFGKS